MQSMQVYIDLAAEPIAALHLHAQFVLSYAELRTAVEANGGAVPAGTSASPLAPPPPPTLSVVGAATPGIPNSGTIVPGTSLPTAAPASLDVSGVGSVGAQLVANTAPAVAVYDTLGVPWDARIHQKLKSTKKDGTWKLQKGIADSLVAQVMQELAPLIRTSQAPPPPSAGSLPPGPTAPPPPPANPPSGVTPTAPPPPSTEAFNPQGAFPALVAKITAARQANRITTEELTRIYAENGAPSLQALNALPSALGNVSLAIDVLLASR